MSPAELDFRRAALDEILALRHVVLRPGLPLDTARFLGDAAVATRHFGAFPRGGGSAVACVSCMRAPRAGADAWQVRGMATRGDLAGHGIGRALLAVALDTLRAENGPRLAWCNARVTALPFWLRTGWSVVSDVFDIPGVGPHRLLECRL